ncbi:nose resistant to fluoxetine protein 6-like [Wyeomyia smithii]|uniref:nose resistant to fluoxetine protein 6-like n=1 Tax=Wyeomyia smithii TaxID=174621 RepID=UPI002467B11F|nr:nose resistant to fluoxetine protein 6-like [Wyeomyia smithii]
MTYGARSWIGRIGSLVSLLALIGSVESGDRFIDQVEYGKFPKLYDYDDFEACRRNFREQYIYCVVKANIRPDNESLVWRSISHFSEDERHYQHRMQERGLCVQQCDLSIGKGQAVTSEGHTHADQLRTCINSQLLAEYGLQVESDVEIFHCYNKFNENLPFDWLEIMFMALALLLLVAVCFSTWYDLLIESASGFPDNYFSRSHNTSNDRLLTAFSIPRNIRRLKEPIDSLTKKDMAFVEAFRFGQMHRVILLHIILVMVKVPKVNPEGIEKKLYHPLTVHYVAEFQHYVQSFFSISGMLLAVNFLEHIEANPKFDMQYFWSRLRARLYRLVPAYAFIILLEASISRRFMSGPIGQHLVGDSHGKCRKLWWSNLLFVNNYSYSDSPCLIQSWYLSADMQLYIFALGTLMVIWRWPVLKRYLLTAGIAWGFILTTIVVYTRNVSPVMTEDLKLNEQYNFGHSYFQLYQPFHMNISIYFAGMLAGFIYHRYRSTRRDFLKSRLQINTFWTLVLVYFFTCFTDSWVVEHRSTMSPLVLALYATVFKHSWGVLCTVIHLRSALQTRRSRFRSFCGHPIFRVLGKLCYSFFLIHFTVILQVLGSVKQPIYFSPRGVVEFMMSIQMWTLLYGTLLCILIELPMNVALRELLERRKERSPTVATETEITDRAKSSRG